MAFAYELLDKKYATREEWQATWEAYSREPVICAHCLHPVDFDIDAGTWRHKESVPWCGRMREQKGVPIKPVVHGDKHGTE